MEIIEITFDGAEINGTVNYEDYNSAGYSAEDCAWRSGDRIAPPDGRRSYRGASD